MKPPANVGTMRCPKGRQYRRRLFTAFVKHLQNLMSYAKRIVFFAPAALLTAGIWQDTFAQQPNIVGTWEWARKKNGCLEQHVYRSDGTLTITTGEKRTDNTYLMSWAPEPNGRYKLTVVTVKDHGGRDCRDSNEDHTGRQTVVYVLFSQSRESMIQCDSPAGADCTGLMKRTAP